VYAIGHMKCSGGLLDMEFGTFVYIRPVRTWPCTEQPSGRFEVWRTTLRIDKFFMRFFFSSVLVVWKSTIQLFNVMGVTSKIIITTYPNQMD
jgi:hypothetical protein